MLCLIHRWNINRTLDKDRELSARTAAHVARCAHCRVHLRTQQRLVARLAHPPSAKPEAPAFFRSRVLNVIRDEQPQPAQPTMPVWLPVGSLAVLALVLALWPARELPGPDPQAKPIAKAPAAPPTTVATVPVLPKLEVTTLLQRAQKSVTSPHEREVRNLQNDLRAVGDYLTDLVPTSFANR